MKYFVNVNHGSLKCYFIINIIVLASIVGQLWVLVDYHSIRYQKKELSVVFVSFSFRSIFNSACVVRTFIAVVVVGDVVVVVGSVLDSVFDH